MATVKLYNNVFDNEYKEFSFDNSKTLLENIEENTNKNVYKETLVECYDPETGKTFYAPLEEGNCSVLITVNGRCVDENYLPQEHDVILVFFLPLDGGGSRGASTAGGAVVGFLIGAAIGIGAAAALVLTGGAAAIGLVPAAAVLLGGVGGGIIGGVAGGIVGGKIWDQQNKKNITGNSRTVKNGKEGKSSPDVRGAENQSLRGNNYPFVIGKHLVTPFIVGDPVTEYSGTCGKDAYIRVLYCIGYGPLKLTDFKLGEFMLAYNKSHGNTSKRTMMSGLLRGYSTGGSIPVEGDIDDYWKNNDISLELIQYKGSGSVVQSNLYPYAEDVQELNANTFYLADKQLQDNCQVVYKGTSFPNKFKTNGVFFSASCPKKVTINFDLPQGLYSTHTHSDDNTTTTEYDKISLWYCIQWRPYNVNNAPSDPNGRDFSNWNTISSIRFGDGNGDTLSYHGFGNEEMEDDIDNHLGNDFGLDLHPGMDPLEIKAELQKLYGYFTYQLLFNIGDLWDKNLTEDDLISQIRLKATIDLTKAQCQSLLADTCTTNSIEIRVIRVSPNYLNETSTDSEKNGPYSYSDMLKVSSIVTESFDKEELEYNNSLVTIRPQKDVDMKKFCYVAIRAKADESGYLVNQLGSLNCIAESFSPIWDLETKKILPEGIHKVSTYYGYYDNSGSTLVPCNRSNNSNVVESVVSKNTYENARRNGLNWVEDKQGSNLASIMRGIIFVSSEIHAGQTAYYLPQAAEKYNDNRVSSGFLLACMGLQNGPVGMGAEDVNILSIADWAENTEALTDGSTFKTTTTYRGQTYQAGDLIPVHYEANAYIYSGTKLEDVMTKIAAAGRAVWIVDETGKIKVIMDRPADYTKGVISAQTCLQSSNQFGYDNLPAGLFLAFSDENDGYEQNSIYCWDDGYSEKKYHGQVESCAIDFVTNNYQIWSLGRYLLACRVAQKEVLTRKIGVEGAIYEIGDVLLVQDDELLIGDTSGRIQEIIEESGVIYGFVTDTTYEYKAEAGTGGNSNQGITAMQPGYMGKSNAVTLPIAMPSSRTIHYTVEVTTDGQTTTQTVEKTFTLKKGITNIVLFGTPVTRSASEDPSTTLVVKYNFKTGDICLFGIIDKISAPYRIIKVKPEKDGTFTETLIPYNENIYNYGAELPSFQKFITPPPVETYPTTLSDVPTTLKEMNDSRSDMYGKIDGIVNGNADVSEPDDILTITAIAHRDSITVNWSPIRNNGLKNTLKYYILQYIKSGDDWTNANVVYPIENTYTYTFDRSSSADGYPEVADISDWRFRVKAVNVYNKKSVNWKTTTSLNTQNYGTWIPASPSFDAKIPDEGGITFSWSRPTSSISGRTLYGTPRYTVTVKYTDSEHSVPEQVMGTLVTSAQTTMYNFDRNLSKDGYPEKIATASYKGLDKYTFILSVENESGNLPVSSSAVTFTPSELNNYKTWIPSAPIITKKIAEENGITFEWNDVSTCYGNNHYTIVIPDAEGTIPQSLGATRFYYTFLRESNGVMKDGYPEPGELIDWDFTVKAVNNQTNRESTGSVDSVDVSEYLGWLPNAPVVQSRSSGRTCTVSPSNAERRYGKIMYKIMICNPAIDREEEGGNITYKYYLPTPTADPFGAETNYKNASQENVPILSDSPYSQTMPLKDQAATKFKKYSFVNADDPLDYDNGTMKLLIYTETQPPATATQNDVYIDGVLIEDAYCWTDSGTNFISFEVSMPSPKDTMYWWKIASYNAVTESLQSKTSAYTDAQTTAFATSAFDVVKAGITENALAPDAVTTDKIAAGTITANKIFVEALSAISANLGAITDGSLVGNANNYWYLSDEYDEQHQLIHRAGDFRVGGATGDFISCSTSNGTDYNIEIQASQFNITAIGTVVKGQFYVSPTDAVISPMTGLPDKYIAKITPSEIRLNTSVSIGFTSQEQELICFRIWGDSNHWYVDAGYFKSVGFTEKAYITRTLFVSAGNQGNAFFSVNPSDTEKGSDYDTQYPVPAETVRIKDGKFMISDASNNTKFLVDKNGTVTTASDIHVGKGKSIIADGTKANYAMIKFKDNTGDAYGNGVVIGGGGAVVIGGGESADVYYSEASLSAGSEVMAITNDGDITFVSNLQNGYANRKTMTMDTDGKLTNSQGFVGPLTGNATSASRLSSIAIANIRIGSAQARISLKQLMTWLITTKAYIPSGVDCYKVLGVPWDYAGNDILQLTANGQDYELQLAGCLIEFMGIATDYDNGRYRLTIHSSPTNSFSPSTNRQKFPVSTAVTYTCNGSNYNPVWKIDMPIKKANGFWGFQTPKEDGRWGDSDWIRTTSLGIIPYQSGGADAGHQSLGTSTWYFASAYIQDIYGYLHGNISGSSTSCTGNSATATNATKLGNIPVQSSSIGGTTTETGEHWAYVKKAKFTTTGGYIVYSNGLMIQWGLTSNTLGSSYQDVNLIGYSNTNYVIFTSQLSTYDSTRMSNLVITGGNVISKTVARITGRRPGGGESAQIWWCTIGY